MKELINRLAELIEHRVERLKKLVETPVVKLDSHNFEEVVAKSKMTVVLFTAPWCHPCKAYDPLFEIVARKLVNQEGLRDVVFGKVDTDENPHIADKYHVDRIPSTIIYLKGHVADVIVGAVTEDELQRRIKELYTRL